MTEYHLKAVARFCSDIRLAYDADSAGLAAAERAIEMAQQLGIDLSVVTLGDEAKDPDELIQKDPKLWQQAIAKAEPAVDWMLAQYEKRLDLKSATGKREYSTVAIKLISRLTDPVVRDHYYQLVSHKIAASVAVLKTKLAAFEPTPTKKLRPVKAELQDIIDADGYQDSILAILLVYPKLRFKVDDLDPTELTSETRRQLAKLLVTNAPLDNLGPELDNYIDILKLRAEGRYEDWSEDDLDQELRTLLAQFKTRKLKTKRDSLLTGLKDAEMQQDARVVEELLNQINQLNKEIGK
jgi:DNA primase